MTRSSAAIKAAYDDPAERAAHMLSKFDADKDGSLSATELAEHPKLAGKFAEVDTDKDGKLTRDEMEKGRELMKAKMKARFEADRAAAKDAPADAK